MAFPKLAAEIWRAFVTDGVPASGVNPPSKPDIIVWGTEIESRLPESTPVGGSVLIDTFFQTGRPWADVRAYGAVGDGVTDDTAACQGAIDAVEALNAGVAIGGGIVFFPPGSYSVPGGLVVSNAVTLMGAGMDNTVVQAWHTDITVIHLESTAQYASVREMTVYGKGLNQDTGTFGATQNALVMSCTSGILTNLTIWGGNYALYVDGNDCLIQNVYPSASYANAACLTSGGNWWFRNKIDHAPTGIALTTSQPYPNRANTTAYTVGQVRILSGYAIQCSVAGTSAGSAPSLKNYGVAIVDGTVTWLLLAKNDYTGMLLGGASGENNISFCDFSGDGYIRSISLTNTLTGVNGPAVCNLDHCVFSSTIDIQNGVWTRISASELGASISVDAGYTGKLTLTDNYATTSGIAVSIGAGVSNFNITNNILPSGSITIAVGASDHYIVTGNIGTGNPTDGGTGTHKVVTGNVT